MPSVHEGVVRTTACINQDRECCVGELDISVRNCSSFVVYKLKPTPGCNMGYCVGEGVPCPSGLASSNGYTPCDCKLSFYSFPSALSAKLNWKIDITTLNQWCRVSPV